ncbi:response regulator transcription factor [Corallibacter vietnamensis]|uniref:Response regulator transcription factor n=1 Tax=Corallibacter vietnamensis TaxID=904130 RepID=A0ABP7H0M0_9FLAO
MKKVFNILIVDDHPMIIEGYSNTIKWHFKEHPVFSFNIESATSIDETVKLVDNILPQNKFDLVFLDISLPDGNTTKMHSGEDLGLFIKSKLPNVKIIAITALNDTVRLLNIIKKLSPHGLLIKSDTDGEVLTTAIKNVIKGRDYCSHSIVALLKKRVTQNKVLDDHDIQLLVELSNGAKMKELLELLPLTKSGIEKRRRLLKEKLNVKSNSDRDLVLKAKEMGFI